MPLENPFQDPLRFERRIPECAVVIFGANGDLTKRKLMPALYRLAYERRLAPGFAVIGISRTAMSDDEFRENMHESVAKFLEDSPFDEDLWRPSRKACSTWPATSAIPSAYKNLAAQAEADRRVPAHGGKRSVLSFDAAQPIRAGWPRASARRDSPKAKAGGASSSKSRSGTIWRARAS